MGAYLGIQAPKNTNDEQSGKKVVSPRVNEENIKLIKILRHKISHYKLMDLLEIYNAEFYPKENLDFEEFDNLFAPILNNSEPFFELMQFAGEVNFSQMYIGMCVFCRNILYDDRIQLIFTSYDIDGSGELDRKETGKFLEAAIQSLCKLAGL